MRLCDLKDLQLEDEDASEESTQPESEGIDPDALRKYSKDICLTIGYLLGVKIEYLTIINGGESVDEVFQKLEKNLSAKAIRHLNNMRSNLILNFKSISQKIRITSSEYTPIYKVPMLEEDFKQLDRLGIQIVTGRQDLNEYLTIINNEIMKRINDTKCLFPEWIEFRHINFMFNMPINNIKSEGEKFQINQNCYPYKRYFNWKKPESYGNILLYDLKLLNIIYSNNNDIFEAIGKVSDASTHVKNSINNFIAGGNKIQLFVDGENCDPYKLQATIDGLQDYEIEKIDKIVVYYDSKFSPSAWKYLHLFTYGIEVDAKPVERIKEDKSLVDHKLIAGVSKAVYAQGVDSIILVSSDSDFWAVMEEVQARYLVMVETSKCGPDLKNILREHEIFYCYIDRFIDTDDNEYLKFVFREELLKIVEEIFTMPSAVKMLNRALMAARAEITQAEKDVLMDEYLAAMTLRMNKDKNFEIVIPE